MVRTLKDAVFEALMALPEVTQVRSHGTPTFKVSGKTFAYWALNHHDDGRVALWLCKTMDQQQALLEEDPKVYFVPPYLGVRGWVGLDLTHGVAWERVLDQMSSSWQLAAPKALGDQPPPLSKVPAPSGTLRPEDINPLLRASCQRVLAGLAERCDLLPETSAEDRINSCTWRVGKKVFLRGGVDDDRLKLMFRVGGEMQAMLVEDPRYTLPAHYHASGWVALDVENTVIWEEIEGLLVSSYRHYALKRQLRALDESPPW